MRQWISVFLICLAVVCSGCEYAAKSPQPVTVTATPEDVETGEQGSGVELPVSHGPLDRNHLAVKHVQHVIRSVESRGGSEYFSASQLQTLAERSNFSTVAVSGCDLEILKVFVASDWVPVVIMQSPVGPKHVRALVGYDDSDERLVIIDPVNYAEMRLGYSEFSDQWMDPQDACLLVFPQRVVYEDTVKKTLTRYLPEEKVESISIRVPKRR